MNNVGFRGARFTNLRTLLTNKRQLVCIDGLKSTVILITAEVHQRSVLSPLLLNAYVKNILGVSLSVVFLQYADDVTLLSRHIDYKHTINILHKNIMLVLNWFSDKLIDINFSKTNLVCFSNLFKRVNLDFPLFLLFSVHFM